MSNTRRCVSFQFKNNKGKPNNLADPMSITTKSDKNGTVSNNEDYMFRNNINTSNYPGSLSRKSLSAAVLNELQTHSLYRKQQVKLEPRKSSSVEFLDNVSRKNDKKNRNVFILRENRRSTSLSDLFNKRNLISDKKDKEKCSYSCNEILKGSNLFSLQTITMNYSDALYFKKPKEDVQLKLGENRQNSLRKNRKNNLNTRSVWYDDSDRKEGYFGKLRKATSLDSLLTDKKQTRSKITKDMISAPLCPRKIFSQWNEISEKEFHPIVEELYSEPSDYSDSDSSSQQIDENITTKEDEEYDIIRSKDHNYLTDNNKRKNIFHHNDLHLIGEFQCKRDESVSNNHYENNNIDKVKDTILIEKLNKDDNEDQENSKVDKNEAFINSEKIIHEGTEETQENVICKKKKAKKPKKQKDSGSNLIKMKFLSKSTDVFSVSQNGKIDTEDYQEVLRTLQTNKDEPLSRSVGPFPKTDDHFISDDVQLRPNRIDNRLRQSKTIDCDPRKYYRNQDFDVKGCTKIQLPDNVPIRLKKNEYLQYQNNSIIKSDETNSTVLKFGVILKSVKLANKREVELRDVNNQMYLLIFDSSKDAKLFIENDKVSCFTDTEKSTITKTLLRLLGKRSSREVLEKKGIYQNEPIFGNTLKNIYNSENAVPKFILKTMELIERPDNITSLGLYRTSGNLATIQKIRLEVDKGNLEILETYGKDPDVLTGSLKLFFRELKEPLLSCKTCDNLLEFTKNDKNYCKKDRENIRTILSHIPESNAETLLALIRHLIEVVKYKDLNKMDTYNLAVCWGPTIIFATDNLSTKDLVTQSAEATKLFDALLNFYTNNPDELDFRRKRLEYVDSNRNMIHRQDSKDSIQSSDSNNSSNKNKSSSNLSLDAIDEVLKKSVDLIEGHLDSEGIYKKSGSTEKVNKIVRKMLKRKLSDLDKYRHDVYDLTESLKKYLKEGCDSLVSRETVEHVNKICDNTQWLEHNTRQKVMTIVMDVPKKDTLIFLVRHLIKLIKYESSHNVSKSEMLWIWSRVFNDQTRITDSDEKMVNFLKILVDVFDETKSDISVKPKGMSNGLLNDLKNMQKEKDRISKYDNVLDETDCFAKESTIFEEKTDESEQTKL